MLLVDGSCYASKKVPTLFQLILQASRPRYRKREFVTSKRKISQVKPETFLRLELCAAVLLVKLWHFIIVPDDGKRRALSFQSAFQFCRGVSLDTLCVLK